MCCWCVRKLNTHTRPRNRPCAVQPVSITRPRFVVFSSSARVAVILLRASRARPGDVKGEERQLGRRVDDDVRKRADAAPGVERQPPLFGNRVTKGGRAEELHREPDTKAGKPARQLRAMLTRIVEIVRMRHRRQIGGRRFVRGAKRRPIAHEQRAGAVGKEHALVRIERQRVGAGQARGARVAQVVRQSAKNAP